jgi:CHAT domain-containing protein
MRGKPSASLLAALLVLASSPAPADPIPLEIGLFRHELGPSDAETFAPAEAENLTGLALMYIGAGRPTDAVRIARIAERVIERGIAMSPGMGVSEESIAAQRESLKQVRSLITVAGAALGKTEAAFDGSLANATEAALGERDPDARLFAFSDVAYITLVSGDFGVARDFAKAGLDEIKRLNPRSPTNAYADDTPEETAAMARCEQYGENLLSRSQGDSARAAAIIAQDPPPGDCEGKARANLLRDARRTVHEKFASIYADATLAIDPGRAAIQPLSYEIEVKARYGTNNASALLKMGYLLRSLGNADAAKLRFENARLLAKRDVGLGALDSYSGQASPAAGVFGVPGESGMQSTAYLLAGETELAAGRPDAALTFFDAANAGIQSTIASSGLTGARALYLKGLAKLRLGRADQSLVDLSAASELYDSYTPTSRDLRRLASGRFDTAIDVHLALLEAALDVGNSDLAGAAAARAARAGISRSSGAALVRLQSGATSSRVRAAQDAARAATAAEDQLQGAIASNAGVDAIRAASEAVATTRQRARQSLDAVLAEHPELSLFGVGSAATTAQIQSRLLDGEAVLMFAVGRDRAYSVAVTKSGFRAVPVTVPRTRIQDLVRQVAESSQFVRRGGQYATRPFARAEAGELYRILVAPLMPALAGVSRAYVARNGVLDGLPFNTLYDAEGNRWFGDILAFSIVPEPSLVGLASSRLRSATAGVLGVGDPAIRGASWLRDLTIDGTRPARVEAAPAAAQSQLAGAREELAAVLQAWPSPRSKLLVGPEATEQSFRRAASGNYRVMAFATHAVTASPRFRQASPALVFTPGPRSAGPNNDGLLHPTEIEDLSIRSELVLLSACETAAGSGLPNAETLSGLAQAFLYAGARSVVATHWKVDSASAAALIQRAMAAQSAGPGTSVPAAFRSAAAGVRALPGKAHPAFWAPFVVVETGER